MIGTLYLLAAAFVKARSIEEDNCPSCFGGVAANSLLQQQFHSGRGAKATGNSNDPDLSPGHCLPKNGALHVRVRQHVFDMPYGTWITFSKAWRALESKGKYAKYAYEHEKHYASPMKDHNGQPGFLPFHRGTIQDLESELQKEAQSCDLAFPFWNWALEVGAFASSAIWSKNYMGEARGCVKSGLPAGWKFPPGSNDCVSRAVTKSPKRTGKTIDELELLVEQNPDYGKFCRLVEGVHNAIHGAIGGNMASKVGLKSPSEPMFYLHHAFIDQIYFQWQKYYPYKSNSCPGCRGEIKLWTGKYIKDKDCVLLPVHRKFQNQQPKTCVRYNPARNSAPPGNALLENRQEEGACVKLKLQIENGECSPEEMSDMECVDTEACAFDEKEAEEEAISFVGASGASKAIDELRETAEEPLCKKFAVPASPEEARMCLKCNYVCTGGH